MFKSLPSRQRGRALERWCGQLSLRFSALTARQAGGWVVPGFQGRCTSGHSIFSLVPQNSLFWRAELRGLSLAVQSVSVAEWVLQTARLKPRSLEARRGHPRFYQLYLWCWRSGSPTIARTGGGWQILGIWNAEWLLRLFASALLLRIKAS